MKSALLTLGNIPVRASVIGSLYPDIKVKNKKVALLEHSNEIIRLKKGLYVVNPEESGIPLCIELIANHLYSPSYVSMSSALRYYGLIPEAVYTVQSMTVKQARSFENSIGEFTFTHIDRDAFSIGLRQEHSGNDVFVIASPEKALCDLIASTPSLSLRYVKEAKAYLEEDIRFDMDAFYQMNADIFNDYIRVGKKSGSIRTILKLLQR